MWIHSSSQCDFVNGFICEKVEGAFSREKDSRKIMRRRKENKVVEFMHKRKSTDADEVVTMRTKQEF